MESLLKIWLTTMQPVRESFLQDNTNNDVLNVDPDDSECETVIGEKLQYSSQEGEKVL